MTNHNELFRKVATRLDSWNPTQTLYRINDLRQLPFTPFVMDVHSKVDYNFVKKIQKDLDVGYQKNKKIHTVNWMIRLGTTQSSNNYVCLDGQHRWIAGYEWGQINQLEIPVLFVVETFDDENEIKEVYCQNHHTLPLLTTNPPINYVEIVVNRILEIYPKLTLNTTKPYISKKELTDKVALVSQTLPEKEKRGAENRPHLKNPELLVKVIQWMNERILELSNEEIIKKGLVDPSPESVFNEVREIGCVLGYQPIWNRIIEVTKNHSHQWKHFNDEWSNKN